MSTIGPLGSAALPPREGVSGAGLSPKAPDVSGSARRGGMSRFAEIAGRHPPVGSPPGVTGARGPLGAAAPEGPSRAAAPEGIGKELGRILGELRTDERRLDAFYRRALRGGHMEPQELLAMQALVYRYSQRVDVLSKLLERMTGALKQTLQTQM